METEREQRGRERSRCNFYALRGRGRRRAASGSRCGGWVRSGGRERGAVYIYLVFEVGCCVGLVLGPFNRGRPHKASASENGLH